MSSVDATSKTSPALTKRLSIRMFSGEVVVRAREAVRQCNKSNAAGSHRVRLHRPTSLRKRGDPGAVSHLPARPPYRPTAFRIPPNRITATAIGMMYLMNGFHEGNTFRRPAPTFVSSRNRSQPHAKAV